MGVPVIFTRVHSIASNVVIPRGMTTLFCVSTCYGTGGIHWGLLAIMRYTALHECRKHERQGEDRACVA